MLAIIVFLATGVVAVYRDLQSQVTTEDISNLIAVPRPTTTASSDDYEGRAVNILIMGSDSRNGQVIDDGTEGMRADTTMLMHISADRTRIEIVSIPRDTMLGIPECTLPDGTTSAAADYAMFNSAFATGAGSSSDIADVKYAAACTVATVEQLTGIYIDDYMVVDFTGFENMVNALGGVPLYIDEEIDDDLADLHLPAGCNYLNGYQALGYARVRYSVGDGSDLSRIGRQQALVASIMRTAMSKNLLTDLPSLYAFIQASLATLTTSPQLGRLDTLAGLTMSVQNIGLGGIRFVTMPYAPDPWDPENRVVPSWQAEAVWEALINDTPVPEESVSVQGDGSVPSQAGGSEDLGPSGAVEETTTSEGEAAPAPAAPTEGPAAACYNLKQ